MRLKMLNWPIAWPNYWKKTSYTMNRIGNF